MGARRASSCYADGLEFGLIGWHGGQGVKPVLAWGLGCTLLASAWALWWPQPAQPVVALSRPQASAAAASMPGNSSLPAQWPQLVLAPAQADPFAADNMATPTAQPPVQPVPLPVVATVAPAPVAPSTAYRFLGRMAGPSGQQLVYLSNGAQDVPVAPGSKLDDGFVVSSVGEKAIVLVHAETGTKLELAVPAVNQR